MEGTEGIEGRKGRKTGETGRTQMRRNLRCQSDTVCEKGGV